MIPGRIQSITFDVGGTLLEPWPSVGHVYAGVAADHGHPALCPDKLNRQFLAAWRARGHFAYTEAAWSEIVDATFGGLLPRRPSESFFPALYRRFLSHEVWKVYNDVVPALAQLKAQGLRLAVLSNWDDRLVPILQAVGLMPWFETVVVSGEVGLHKPNMELFAHAAEQLDLPPQSILHVGDSVREDVEGARAAGFAALQISRGAVHREPWQLASLGEIPHHLPPA